MRKLLVDGHSCNYERERGQPEKFRRSRASALAARRSLAAPGSMARNTEGGRANIAAMASPSPLPPPSRLSRRRVLEGFGAVAIGAAAGTVAHGFLYERFHVEVTERTLDVAGWPSTLAGLRIGFLTDLHRSATVSHEMIAGAVDLVMARHPDLVVIGGDYVTNRDHRYVQPAAEALRGLAAPHGVFAVLGNHDDERDMSPALQAEGFTVLRDARTQLMVRGEPIDIAGLRYWTHRMPDVARVVRGASPTLILIAHTPKRLLQAAALSVPLLLSGHTHGGQIVLPGIGAVAAHEFPVVAGSERRDNTTVFVSRGVGTVYVPVRINCPPEVAILSIHPLPG
jgi:predicted MPP superfamily phosphohydrolase